jgi:predicted DNA-binding mobile mystery protein A
MIHHLARESLDSRLMKMRKLAPSLTPPNGGWIRAVRLAIGMRGRQFAQRLGVAQPTAHEFEKSEVKGTATIETLRRAASALNCTFVYAIVPNETLEKMVRERALKIARERMARVNNTMALENQQTAASSLEKQIARLADEILDSESRAIWNEP